MTSLQASIMPMCLRILLDIENLGVYIYITILAYFPRNDKPKPGCLEFFCVFCLRHKSKYLPER